MLWWWLAVEAFFIGFFLLGYIVYRKNIRQRDNEADRDGRSEE